MEALKDAVRATDDCEFRRTFHSDQGWPIKWKTIKTT